MIEELPYPKAMEKDNSLYALRPLVPIKTAKDLREYKDLLLVLLDLKGNDAKGFSRITRNGEYVKSLSECIKTFENKKFGTPKTVTGVQLLKFLMEQNGLTQSDFKKEIGPQGNVSLILAGKRSLTIQQIKKLSKRFKVSAERFLQD